MIEQRELTVMLNIALTDEQLLQRIDDVAEALTDGMLCAVTDGDLITALTITAAGRRLMKPATFGGGAGACRDTNRIRRCRLVLNFECLRLPVRRYAQSRLCRRGGNHNV
jgi:hypothetical protein